MGIRPPIVKHYIIETFTVESNSVIMITVIAHSRL